MPERYETDFKIGDQNIRPFGTDIHNPVFLISTILILVFVIGTLAAPEAAKSSFDGAKAWSINGFDWLFMVAGNVFVLFCLFLIFSSLGKIRIGGQEARPEFSRMSWFAMLFAAGMGIGLMFWSVAEPVAKAVAISTRPVAPVAP